MIVFLILNETVAMKHTFLISIICSLLFCANAQHNYPIPTPNAASLFYIQHSDNHNTYVYEAVIKGKLLDSIEPISVHRKMYTKNGETEPLNALQRAMAYGVESKKLRTNFYEVRIVSFKQMPFYLMLNNKNKPVVFATVNNKKMYIDHIFLQIKTGSGISIKPAYAIFTGKNFSTGAKITEKFLFE